MELPNSNKLVIFFQGPLLNLQLDLHHSGLKKLDFHDATYMVAVHVSPDKLSWSTAHWSTRSDKTF